MAEKPKTKRAVRATDPPAWLNETPTMEYTLEACPSSGGIDQSIKMTMEQYEHLKRVLAGLQGYTMPKETAPYA